MWTFSNPQPPSCSIRPVSPSKRMRPDTSSSSEKSRTPPSPISSHGSEWTRRKRSTEKSAASPLRIPTSPLSSSSSPSISGTACGWAEPSPPERRKRNIGMSIRSRRTSLKNRKSATPSTLSTGTASPISKPTITGAGESEKTAYGAIRNPSRAARTAKISPLMKSAPLQIAPPLRKRDTVT